MLSVNWKHVQLVKIYMPCNFEVNLITCLGVIALFSSFSCFWLATVSKILLLWNCLAKWSQTWQEASYVRSSIKLLHLVRFGQQTWPPRLIFFSDWLMLKKSPLKQLGQMEPNLAGSIYVRSKPGIDGPWVCPFQNCVRQPHPPFKMAAVF